MKILMIISEAPPVKSGIARVAEKLSEGIQKRGHKIDILSIHDIPRYEVGEIRISSMPWKLSQLQEKIHEYDIVHLHGPVPTFSDVFLLKGLHRKNNKRPSLVYTHHAPIDLPNLVARPFTKLYNFAQEVMARLADHVVVTSPSYRDRLSRFVSSEKLSVVPWGVDYEDYYSPVRKNGQYTVVYFGQLRPYKGLPVLLRASVGLENTRIWVIGSGHSVDKYQQMASNHNLKNTTFFGQVSDERAVELLQKAHVLVLPSITRSEAFGIVLLEGMAAGLVPVASHLPGVVDVVGSEGLTFPAGDFKALNGILARLRDETAYRQHLASLAQAKVALYSWERVIYGYERIYRNQLRANTSQIMIAEDKSPTQPVLEKIQQRTSGND